MNRMFRAATAVGVFSFCAATFAVSAALFSLDAPAYAQTVTAAPAATGAVRGQATWDDRYLYVTINVDDPNVLGTNTLPLSDPQKDDSVAVYVQTGDARPEAPDANTNAMLVSAAGGFTWLTGDAGSKTMAPKPVFSIKYGVTVQGTLNRSDDVDKGYNVELAMPWESMGVAAGAIKAGAPFSINIIARDRAGRSFSSLSPEVKTEEDITNPSKWLRLTLGASDTGEAPAGAIFAPPVAKRDGKPTPPLIDGVVKVAGEWSLNGRFAFAVPTQTAPQNPVETPKTPVVVVTEDNTPPAVTLTVDTMKGIEPQVFARYSLQFQGDLRKVAEPSGTFDIRTGHFLLADDPANGAGPWFSADRATWHRGLLYEMRRSGVDSALVSVGAGDIKPLYVLAETLREMTQDGLPTPKIALELDTTKLSPEGTPLDVSTTEGQIRLYATLRQFFGTIPPQFRTRITLPVSAGGVPAYPVFLTGSGLTGTEGAGWTDALRKAFALEFGAQSGGAALMFVGGSDFDAAKSPGLVAGGVPLALGGAAVSGALPIYVVQPGIESGEKLVQRKDGDTYKAAWEAALAAKPKWYILDSWNDFMRGTEIVASRQYGTRYLDLTRIYTVQTGNLEGIDVRWRSANVPRRLRVGQTAPIIVSVQNSGGKSLRAEDGYALSYRWKQGDKVVAEAPLRNRLQNPFLPTQTQNFLLGLTSLMLDGTGKLAPLPPGDYSLEIDFIKLKDPKDLLGEGEYLTETGIAPLVVPVSLYNDNRQGAIFEGTTTPALMQAGGTYPVTVNVRYMGADDIPLGAATLTWQLVSNDGKNAVVATGTTPVNEVMPSGVPIPVLANIALNDPTGIPVPPSSPELAPGVGVAGGGYKLRWFLGRTDSTDAISGEATELVAVYGGDEEMRFPLPDKVPASVEANTMFNLDVRVINRGSKPWKKGEYLLGAHWYFSDGMEAVWKPAMTAPLPRDIAPNEEATITLPVRTPENDGSYIMVPDVIHAPEEYLSTRPVSRIGDITPIYIRVTGGRQIFLDLKKEFNVDAVASETKPADGDLDGGATFPAESFPPDRFGVNAPEEPKQPRPDKEGKTPKVKPTAPPAYPSGYYADYSTAARRIAFRYGSTADGAKNAIACAKQVINVPKDNYTALNLAITATGGQAQTIPVILTYADKTTETVNITVPDWNTPQAATGDAIATMTRRKRTAQTDEAKACYLRHIITATNVGKQLASITLPDNPKVKVFAITLDR